MRKGRTTRHGRRFAAAAATVALAALTLTGITTDPAPAHVRITTDINFANDVRPILRRYCMPCHNPKGSAPDYIDLTTYGNDAKPGARAWAVAIEEELMTGRMPPWTADARYDHFRNSRRMSQQEIDIVVAWVQGGGPQGPRRDLPPPLEFTEEEWVLGYPDVVLEPSAETVVEPGQQTASHREVLSVELEEDAWITGYEFRPQHPGVVYRMAAWVHEPEDATPEQLEVEVQVPYDPFRDEDEPEPTRMRTATAGPQFLGQWLRGDDPVLLPDGAGKRLRRGSTIELVVEYRRRPNDDSRIEISDRSSLGLFLAQTEDEVELWVEGQQAGGELTLKGRRAARPQAASLTITERARLIGLHPHVGDLIATMEVRIHFPDGRTQTALYVPEYDPEFPASYLFEQAVHAPPGTRVELIGSFDVGKAKNPRRAALRAPCRLRTRRSPRSAGDLRAARAAAVPRRHAGRRLRRSRPPRRRRGRHDRNRAQPRGSERRRPHGPQPASRGSVLHGGEQLPPPGRGAAERGRVPPLHLRRLQAAGRSAELRRRRRLRGLERGDGELGRDPLPRWRRRSAATT